MCRSRNGSYVVTAIEPIGCEIVGHVKLYACYMLLGLHDSNCRSLILTIGLSILNHDSVVYNGGLLGGLVR